MDEKQIEDFARWLEQQRKEASYYTPDGIAREAARRFGMSAENRAVLEAAEKLELKRRACHTEGSMLRACPSAALEKLGEAILALHRSRAQKPRFEKFELGIMDRDANEFISLFDETGREKLLALLNQAHETERGE